MIPAENIPDVAPPGRIPKDNLLEILRNAAPENIPEIVPPENVPKLVPVENIRDIMPPKKAPENVLVKVLARVSAENIGEVIRPENIPELIPTENIPDVVPTKHSIAVATPRNLPDAINMTENIRVKVNTVRSGRPVSIWLENARLQNLKLSLKKTIKNVKISYDKVRKKPPELPKPPGFAHVYGKFNVSVPPDKIKKLVDEFSIPENWLKRKGVDREDIKVLRFKDGKWIPIHNIEIPSENDLVRTMSVNQTGNIAIGIIRGILAKAPAKLPDTVEMRENIVLHISEAGPKAPLDIGIENSKIGGIRANFSKVVKNLKTVVEKLKEKPPAIPEPPGLVHAYINISVNKPEASVKNAGITFWVPKEWLATHDISKENVKLLRFHEKTWENLPTKLVGENGTHLKYRAETPGFSTFAITAKAKAGVARFSMKNLSIGKKTLKPGESTAVSVDVKNTGGTTGSKTVKLEIEGEVVDKETVTLSPGESKTVKFPISKEKEGTYEVTVGEISKSFRVVKPPKFEVSNLSLAKTEIKPGEETSISVKVTNTGGKKGTYDAKISVDGKTKTQSISLSPGASETVAFTVTLEKEGTYEVTIEGMSKELKVKKPAKPPEFKVGNLSLGRRRIQRGETTTASVKVTNRGGKKGTYTAKLSIDGKVKTRSVTLKPDESEKVTFQVSVEKAGTYQVKIGELSKTLDVVKPVPVKVQSRAFGEGQKIPTQYTADGKNISPPLTIKGVPRRAKSLALVVVDLDAPGGKFTHWIMWNIPTDIDKIPEDVQKEKVVKELGRAKQGKNDFGKIGYGGPSPPRGSSHRYRFTLYALDKKLELSAGATKKQLKNRMEGHVLQKSKLTGVFKRPKGGGLPWALIGGIIVVVITISAFALYKRK